MSSGRNRRTGRIALLAALAGAGCVDRATAQTSAAAGAAIEAPAVVVDGFAPGIRITGLAPSENVRLHAFRSLERWRNDRGEWKRVRQPLHAYADFAASDAGRIDVDVATPVAGTWTQADPLALLRTGLRFGDPALKDVTAFSSAPFESAPTDRVHLRLERGGRIVSEAAFTLAGSSQDVQFEEVTGEGWHAVYARPADGADLPVVISLHGSEGGSVAKARGRAGQFASQGLAVLAMNWFAEPQDKIQGVPTRIVEIRLEILQEAQEWLAARPEIDPDRISLHGVSKGAEFALLAATRYDWIAGVVAVVPSDVVWEGVAAERGQPAARSSWSVEGQPLPFVPLFAFDPKLEGLYRTNTERYERSRAFHGERALLARIPIEATSARILLLGCDRDEVWASGAMARNLAERMVAAGKSALLELKVYPLAGHQIAGTGTFPIHLYGEPSTVPDAKDLVAEGEAAADAWRRAIAFLTR